MRSIIAAAALLGAILPLAFTSCGRSKDDESSSQEIVHREPGKDGESSSKEIVYREPGPDEKGVLAMFGGTPARNSVNTHDKGLITDFQVKYKKKTVDKNVKWSAKIGTHAHGGPLVAGGRIFVATNTRDPKVQGDKGVLMCFRESDGDFLWQALHDKLDDATQDYAGEGIASTPAVDANRLYYVSNRCELVCADVAGNPDTKEAKFYWKLDMIKELKVYPRWLAACSPLIVGDLVYVVTGNGVENESHTVRQPEAPSFIAVDKMKGTVVWQSDLPGENILDGSWGNPSYAEVDGNGQVIFPGGDGWLYSFEPKTGELLWKFNCNPSYAQYKTDGHGDKNYFCSAPAIYDNKAYIGVGEDPQYEGGVGHFWCVDLTKTPKNKDKDLSPVDDDFDPKSPKNKDSGLVWHFGGEIKPPPQEGREYSFGRTMSTACIHDDLVYIADLEGIVYCLDARTGKQYWNSDIKGGRIWASPYWVDGKVLIGTVDTGELFIFEHGKELKKPTIIELHQGMAVSPVFANGTLYVLTDTTLYAFAKSEK